jgi:cysteine dioxygenase
MRPLHIKDWVKQLARIPVKDFSVPHVSEFVQENAIRPETLAPYLFYSKRGYTRNLICKCDLFEVLAICWNVGQMSSPHSHGGQNCWMATPIGRLRVQNFRLESRNPTERTCRLVATGAFDMDASHPAGVEPEESVHQVFNLAEFGQKAASIHIYSRPYSSCEVHDRNRGTYSVKRLRYFSRHGKLCQQE